MSAQQEKSSSGCRPRRPGCFMRSAHDTRTVIHLCQLGNQSRASPLNVLISFKNEIEKAFVEERKACIEIYL